MAITSALWHISLLEKGNKLCHSFFYGGCSEACVWFPILKGLFSHGWLGLSLFLVLPSSQVELQASFSESSWWHRTRVMVALVTLVMLSKYNGLPLQKIYLHFASSLPSIILWIIHQQKQNIHGRFKIYTLIHIYFYPNILLSKYIHKMFNVP